MNVHSCQALAYCPRTVSFAAVTCVVSTLQSVGLRLGVRVRSDWLSPATGDDEMSFVLLKLMVYHKHRVPWHT